MALLPLWQCIKTLLYRCTMQSKRTRGSAAPIVATTTPAAPTPAAAAAAPGPTLMQAAVAAALQATANPPPAPSLAVAAYNAAVAAPAAAPSNGAIALHNALVGLPAPLQAAVQAAIAAGKVAPPPVVGQAATTLPAPNTVLVTVPPKKALTGKRYGGTQQCYNTAVALQAAGNLTVATISAACAAMGNPQWPQYAMGKWLKVANQ